MSVLRAFLDGVALPYTIGAILFLILAAISAIVWRIVFPEHCEFDTLVAGLLAVGFLTLEVGFTLRHMHHYSVNIEMRQDEAARWLLEAMRTQDTIVNNQTTHFNILMRKLKG